jgi:hypothetical protein
VEIENSITTHSFIHSFIQFGLELHFIVCLVCVIHRFKINKRQFVKSVYMCAVDFHRSLLLQHFTNRFKVLSICVCLNVGSNQGTQQSTEN